MYKLKISLGILVCLLILSGCTAANTGGNVTPTVTAIPTDTVTPEVTLTPTDTSTVSNTTVPTSTPTPTSTSSTKSFSMTEVAKHNSASSCYMVINNNVYDVTDFIDQHPGGAAILDGCGIDATSMFESIHSSRAYSLLDQFLIGVVK